MKRFVFNLDRLLRLRESAELDCAKQLGEAIRFEEQERMVLESHIDQREKAKEQMANLATQAVRAGTMANVVQMVEACDKQVDDARDRHEEAAKLVEAQREKYEAARKDRRVLARLRKKRWAVWNSEFSKEEQAASDEIAARKSTSAGGTR